jgi:hypothetical protein
MKPRAIGGKTSGRVTKKAAARLAKDLDLLVHNAKGNPAATKRTRQVITTRRVRRTGNGISKP